MIIKALPVGIYSANCYIVMDEKTKEAVILDPGGNADIISREVKTLGCKVSKILLTHAHVDHVGAVEELHNLYGAKVLMHEEEERFMELDNYVYGKLPKIYGFINDGDEIEFAGRKIKCIYTPGHTKGGMCFLIKDSLFTGDTLFKESIGRTDFLGGDYAEIIKSINDKILVLPSSTAVYPGHGPSSTVIYERSRNPFLA